MRKKVGWGGRIARVVVAAMLSMNLAVPSAWAGEADGDQPATAVGLPGEIDETEGLDNVPSTINDISTYADNEAMVAENGGTQYATLQAAVDAAEDEATITLISNANGNVLVPAEKNITIDLGTYTLTHVVASDPTPYAIDNKGTLVLKNGTVKGAAGVTTSTIRNLGNLTMDKVTVESDFVAVKNDAITDPAMQGTLIMDGCSLTTSTKDSNTGALLNWGKATVTNTDISAPKTYAVFAVYSKEWNAFEVTTTLKSCNVSGDKALYSNGEYPTSAGSSQVIIEGGTYAAKNSSGITVKNNSTLTTSGEIGVNAGAVSLILSKAVSGTTVTLSSDLSEKSLEVPSGVTFNVAELSTLTLTKTWTLTVSEGAAVNGNIVGKNVSVCNTEEQTTMWCATLANAIRKSRGAGGVPIKLYANISASDEGSISNASAKPLTIDLNGYTIDVAMTLAGDLTVVDTSEGPTKGSITGKLTSYNGTLKDEQNLIAGETMFPAAKIGSTYYKTLQEAINSAANGATIYLVSNTTETVTVAADKDITLALNGYTLSAGTMAGKAAITNNGTLKIIDKAGTGSKPSTTSTGTITRDDDANRSYYVIDNQGTMTIESGNVINTSFRGAGKGASLIRNAGSNAATLNITGGNLTMDGFIAVKNDDLGILNVKGGTIKASNEPVGYTYSAVQNWCEANISGGTIEGAVWTSTWDDSLPASKTVISDGATVTGKIRVQKDNSNITAVPALEITGGTLDVTEWRVTNGGAVAVSGGTFKAEVPAAYCAEGFEPQDNGDGTFGVKVADAAQVLDSDGNVVATCTSLAEAIEKAADGQTVKLLRNVTVTSTIDISKSLTLDLNGCTVTSEVNEARAFEVSASGVTFTVNGETDGSAMAIADGAESSRGLVHISAANVTLTVNGGTYSGSVVTDEGDTTGLFSLSGAAKDAKVALNNIDATVNTRVIGTDTINGRIDVAVNGGTFQAANMVFGCDTIDPTATFNCANVAATSTNGPVFENTGATSVLEDCTFKVTGGSSYPSTAVAVSWAGNTTIKGGTYEAEYGAYVYNSGGTIAIEGGTVTGRTAAVKADSRENGSAATVSIMGGSINGKLLTSANGGVSATIQVSGGIFDSAVDVAYCSAGYEPAANDGNTYGVKVKESVVAQVIDTNGIALKAYETLAAAIAEAQDGQTVKLLADETVNTVGNAVRIADGKSLTIDFNGFEYTANTTNSAFMIVGSGGTSATSTVTLKNGVLTAGLSAFMTIGATGTNGNVVINVEDMTINNSKADAASMRVFKGVTLNIKNTTVNSTNGGGVCAEGGVVAISGNSVFTQKGSSSSYWSTNIAVAQGGTVTVESGTFTSENYGAYVFNTGGTININGGTFKTTGDKAVLKADYNSGGSTINVTGGNFTGSYDINSQATLSVSGGTFSVEVEEGYCASGYRSVKNPDGTFSVTDDLVQVVGSDGTIVGTYDTVEEAVEAAGENSTVKLIQDVTECVVIPEGASLTLDLNGYTLKGEGDHTLINHGTISIVDGSKDSSGTVDALTHAKAALYNYGTITKISGGMFTRSMETRYTNENKDDKNKNSWYTVVNVGTIKEISGGTFTTGEGTAETIGNYSSVVRNGYTEKIDGVETVTGTGTIEKISGGTFLGGANIIKNEPNSTIGTISGGTFTMDNTYVSWWGGNNILQNKGTVDSIVGGTFQALGTGVIGEAGQEAKWRRYGIYSAGTIGEISGGATLVMAGDNNRGVRASSTGSIKITGGSFTVEDTIADTEYPSTLLVKDSGGTFAVSDGSFSSPVPSECCASDYMPATEMIGSMYTVEAAKAVPYGCSLSLKGDIAMNFYMKLNDNLAQDSNAYMEFVHGIDTTQVKVSDAKQVTIGDTVYHMFTVRVAAKEMSDVVVATMYDSNNKAASRAISYSVKQYAQYVCEHPGTYDAKLVSLVKAMVNYGAYSQTNFNYSTDALANDFLSDDEKKAQGAVTSVQVHDAHTRKIIGENPFETSLAYEGQSLILRSETVVRHYFSLGEGANIDEYAFTVNGTSVQPKLCDSGEMIGKYYVDVTDIAAKDLHEHHTLKVSGGSQTFEVSYCALCYAEDVLTDSSFVDDKNLQNTVRALYLYNQAARAYFGTTN